MRWNNPKYATKISGKGNMAMPEISVHKRDILNFFKKFSKSIFSKITLFSAAFIRPKRIYLPDFNSPTYQCSAAVSHKIWALSVRGDIFQRFSAKSVFCSEISRSFPSWFLSPKLLLHLEPLVSNNTTNTNTFTSVHCWNDEQRIKYGAPGFLISFHVAVKSRLSPLNAPLT